MNVFNLTDSQNVSEMLKENIDYVVVKDGNGSETKIVIWQTQKSVFVKDLLKSNA